MFLIKSAFVDKKALYLSKYTVKQKLNSEFFMRLEYFWNTATLNLDSLFQRSYITKFMGRCDPLENDILQLFEYFQTPYGTQIFTASFTGYPSSPHLDKYIVHVLTACSLTGRFVI